MMLFERIESKGLAQFSYLVGDGGKAVVIDPRRDCDIYLELATAAGMQITDVLETHRHEDFAVGSLELADRTGANIWHADPQLPYQYGTAVVDGQTWQVGALSVMAIHTPGHTEGSRSYVLYEANGVPWMVFTGDVLFAGEVGRVDFLGMDRAPEMAGYLYDSIFDKILPLGDGVVLCPAHGFGSACGSTISNRIISTLGLERVLNPRLQASEREAFIELVARKLPKPPYFERMEPWNLAGPPRLSVLPTPKVMSPAAFAKAIDQAVVIDTRDPLSFAAGHVPGALSLPLPQIPNFVGWVVPYDKPILLVVDENNPEPAVRYLIRQGYDDVLGYLAGGMIAWAAAGQPVATTDLLSPRAVVSDIQDQSRMWVLDVRNPEEVAAGHVPGAHPIPYKELSERMGEIPEDRQVVAYCGNGPRSMLAASMLQRVGYERTAMILGGILAWRKHGHPLA